MPSDLCVYIGSLLPRGDPIAVIGTKRARRVLGQRVAVPLAVRRAHECGNHVEIPVLNIGGLAPEIREAEVDVQFEEVDAGGLLLHWEHGKKRVGRTALRH